MHWPHPRYGNGTTRVPGAIRPVGSSATTALISWPITVSGPDMIPVLNSERSDPQMPQYRMSSTASSPLGEGGSASRTSIVLAPVKNAARIDGLRRDTHRGDWRQVL